MVGLAVLFLVIGAMLTEPVITDETPSLNFDINRFIGTWYEVARYDNIHEKGCECVRAEYTPQEEYFTVYNHCTKADGVTKDKTGKMFETDTSGHLKVQFYPLLKSNYNIVYVDNLYQKAIVTSGDNNVWFLSRRDTTTSAMIDELELEAVRRGIDIDKLIYLEGC